MRFIAVILGFLLLLLSLISQPVHPALADWPVRSLAGIVLGLFVALHPWFASLRARVRCLVFDLSDAAFRTVLFFVGTTIAMLIAWFVYDGVPRLDDGVASVFQAKIFSVGKVVLPLPPNSEFFNSIFIIGFREELGHWCGMYPPGWPALLVPGVLLGATWVVNPVLHGLLCVSISLLGAELYGRSTGRVAGLLGLASPLLAMLGGEHLSHTSTAFGLTLCAWATCRLTREGAVRYGLVAGLGWGLAFLCRPLTALVVGGVIALLPLARWRRTLGAWMGVGLAAACAVMAAVGLAAFQKATTGFAQVPGHMISMGARGRMGFGYYDQYLTHTPERGWGHTLERLGTVNHHLEGWPLPLFALVLLPFLAGRARGKEYWLVAPSLGLLAVFATYWYFETCFPARYISEAMPMLLVLAAWALHRPQDSGGAPGPAVLRPWAAPVMASGMAFMSMAGGPWLFDRFHPEYGDLESVLPRVVQSYGISNAVVFMDETGRDEEHPNPLNNYYATGFHRNDLALTGSVVYARNMRNANTRLMHQYPGRAYYLYRFNRATKKTRLFDLVPAGTSFVAVAVQPAEPELLEIEPSTVQEVDQPAPRRP